jgi:hypothetical protein
MLLLVKFFAPPNLNPTCCHSYMSLFMFTRVQIAHKRLMSDDPWNRFRTFSFLFCPSSTAHAHRFASEALGFKLLASWPRKESVTGHHAALLQPSPLGVIGWLHLLRTGQEGASYCWLVVCTKCWAWLPVYKRSAWARLPACRKNSRFRRAWLLQAL